MVVSDNHVGRLLCTALGAKILGPAPGRTIKFRSVTHAAPPKLKGASVSDNQGNGIASNSQPPMEQKPPWWVFPAIICAIGVVLLLFAFWAWSSNVFAGLAIGFGAFAKVISAVLGVAIKTECLESSKSWVEKRVGFLDALAGITAFPALFAVGAELVLS